MKKVINIIILLIFCFYFSACGDTKIINGVEYDTYGFLNESDKKNPDIEYEIVMGNIIWSILLVETIIAPVYFIGFSIMEPVSKKDSNKIKGQI